MPELPPRTSPRRLESLRKAIGRAAPDPGESLVELRETFERATEGLPLAPVDIVAVEDGTVDLEWVLPSGLPRPADGVAEHVLVYLHGGGFSLGSRRTGRPLASWLAHWARLPLVNVDYALTPEAPFGAAVDDVESVVAWLADRHGMEKYILIGDSAGATLSLMSAIHMDARPDLLAPSGLILLSPTVRPGTRSESHARNELMDPQLPLGLVRRFAELTGVDQGAELWPGLAMGADVHLPPTLIQVGTDEVLLDESVDIARMLLARGTEVTLQGWPDMMHVWHAFAPKLDDANRALADLGGWARRALQEPTTDSVSSASAE